MTASLEVQYSVAGLYSPDYPKHLQELKAGLHPAEVFALKDLVRQGKDKAAETAAKLGLSLEEIKTA